MEQAWRYPSTLPAADYILDDGQEDTINLENDDDALAPQTGTITDVYRSRYQSSLPDERSPSLAISVLRNTTGDIDADLSNVTSSGKTEVVFHMRTPSVIAILGIIVAVVALAIFYLVKQQDPGEPDKFFLVQGNDAALIGNDPESEHAFPSEPRNNDMKPPEKTRSPDTPPRSQFNPENATHPGPMGSQKDIDRKMPITEDEKLMMLSTVFKKEQQSVERCLANSESTLAGIDRIFVRFSVNQSGEVTQSSVVPPKLTGTSLAKCIESIANRTRFPKLNKSLSFAIPIAVTRSAN